MIIVPVVTGSNWIIILPAPHLGHLRLERRGPVVQKGDVSSFRLPAMGPDVFMGTFGQASLHSVDMTVASLCRMGVEVEGVVLIGMRYAIAKRALVRGNDW